MSIKLNDKVVALLKENFEKKFTARDIAIELSKIYSTEFKAKKKKSINISNNDELVDQLTREIGSRRPYILKRDNNVKVTEGRPREYYYSKKTGSNESNIADLNENQSTPLEIELYPILSEYLHLELGVFSKRIEEKKSKNTKGKNGNKWLHPDLVGFENLSKNWCEEIKSCANTHYDKNVRMLSFEVKRNLNSSNLRKAFFQAVSNSSWANKGFLVVAEIEGEEIMNELHILSAAHGIGLILLNIGNISESQILIPAREKQAIDWNSCNRLAMENSDFKNYIKEIRKFYQTGETNRIFWDFKESGDSKD